VVFPAGTYAMRVLHGAACAPPPPAHRRKRRPLALFDNLSSLRPARFARPRRRERYRCARDALSHNTAVR
jgi:hypothetical protein